jgi:hypothetical protein
MGMGNFVGQRRYSSPQGAVSDIKRDLEKPLKASEPLLVVQWGVFNVEYRDERVGLESGHTTYTYKRNRLALQVFDALSAAEPDRAANPY